MSDSEKKSKAPLIATIAAAVLAVAAVVVLFFVLRKPTEGNDSSDGSGNGSFQPTQEFNLECTYAAHDLIAQSYEVMRLFVFDGLSYLTEPYGNEPEDGLYTVNVDSTSKYTKLEEIEELVKSVYTDEAAEKILHDIDGNGLSVYQKRKVLVEAEYDDSEPESDESRPMYVEEEVLGISASFKPDKSKKSLWASSSVRVEPKSETTCDLTVYLGGGVNDSTDLSAISEDVIVRLGMIKTENGWRLTEFVC